MRSSIFFTAALAATVLAKPLPQSRSRKYGEAASTKIGVVEVQAYSPAAGLNGFIGQGHGQATEVAFDENAVISVADGPEMVIGRRDVLSRNCRKLPTIPQISNGIS